MRKIEVALPENREPWLIPLHERVRLFYHAKRQGKRLCHRHKTLPQLLGRRMQGHGQVHRKREIGELPDPVAEAGGGYRDIPGAEMLSSFRSQKR